VKASADRAPDSPDDRLAREMEHDRKIAGRAEEIWNWDSPAGRRRADRRAAFFVEHADLRPGRQALEIGCGTGLFAERTARSGATVLGIDLSTDLLTKARARLRDVANVRLERGDVHRLPHPDGAFHAVYGSSILHHLDLQAALGEAHRVLQPGGRIVFTEPNIFNPQVAWMFLLGPREYFGLSPDEMAFSRFRAANVLRGLGFAEIRIQPFDFLHPGVPASWIGPVARVGEIVESVPGVREIAGSLLIRARKR
jgi:SAM-dependent methyltransferase